MAVITLLFFLLDILSRFSDTKKRLLVNQCPCPSSQCDHFSSFLRLELPQRNDSPHSKWNCSWRLIQTTDHRIGVKAPSRWPFNLTHSDPFQVSLPNPRTLSRQSSFIPRMCNLWNALSSSSFPKSYNLPSYKSKINKLDLIFLSS